jgi:hypothetical protein
MGRHSLLSLSCFAAAGAWPTLVTTLGNVMLSPFDRAVQTSICGTALHAAPELLGHCVACWAGSAILAATGFVVLMSDTPRLAQAHARP